MPSVGQRHRHHWFRVQGELGVFECVCGARAVMSDAGFVQTRGKRKASSGR